MHHPHLKIKLAEMLVFSVVVLSAFVFLSQNVFAAVTIPFGGAFTSYVPPFPPNCPGYIVVKNYSQSGLPIFGLIVPSTGALYSKYNFFGRYNLGRYANTPIINCGPYPIFPYTMLGTSN